MEQVNNIASRLEDIIGKVAAPFKPHIPAIARFLLVATFIEDSIRIIFQWSDQLRFLQYHRGFNWALAYFFLVFNVMVMLTGSFMAITKKHTKFAAAGLFCTVISQTLAYNFLFDFKFFLHNLSLIGGLLMLLAEAYHKRQTGFAGLLSVPEFDKSTYFQLAGRILLIFLFLSLVFAGEMTPLRILFSVVGLIACAMVVVGFKAKWSAMFLVLFLSIFNVVINNWWTIHQNHPNRDFVKYDFFQILSVMGGFMLLVSMGPGGLSVDEQKKQL
ncbi:SURF4-domain-containing protein [Basidiobolus meristosporus CBS 931.73]|uniref:SURF4-domain-containing protein n=1 Tax=Basidiobolus meristosporus CBS 931.73 TaxID=1314790 RepID=A0A1Y1Z3H4_9FUNG|nr:SURF4-domain-containing protein [Basidiobolus meristosporus CBS 931.73]|eukprot:ORY04813.1 SURF4-domain-containing protein [Basidiobolus meristosporus CBS 931.73]